MYQCCFRIILGKNSVNCNLWTATLSMVIHKAWNTKLHNTTNSAYPKPASCWFNSDAQHSFIRERDVTNTHLICIEHALLYQEPLRFGCYCLVCSAHLSGMFTTKSVITIITKIACIKCHWKLVFIICACSLLWAPDLSVM